MLITPAMVGQVVISGLLAGSLDSDKVRAELLRLEFKTPFGEYKVDQDGFQTAHKMVLLQWQEGKRVVVWPDDLANGKPRFRR